MLNKYTQARYGKLFNFFSFSFETMASNRFSGDQLAPTHWIFHGAALNLHRMTVEKKKKTSANMLK